MKSENVIRSPLLLFNFSLLTQYVLLFFCLKKPLYKLNKPKIRLNFAADYRPLCLPPPIYSWEW